VTVLVRLPARAVEALDAYVKALQKNGADGVSRASAARALIDLALQRESTTSKLLILRYRILSWLADEAGSAGSVTVDRLRDGFGEVSPDLLDRTLLELETDGAVRLEPGPAGSAAPLVDERRGRLGLVRVLRRNGS
jgi:hypothetical protein